MTGDPCHILTSHLPTLYSCMSQVRYNKFDVGTHDSPQDKLHTVHRATPLLYMAGGAGSAFCAAGAGGCATYDIAG